MTLSSDSRVSKIMSKEDEKKDKDKPKERLEVFCKNQGFDEFAEYAESVDAHSAIEELIRWLMQEKPQNPGKFLLDKYRYMYEIFIIDGMSLVVFSLCKVCLNIFA